MGVQKYPKYLEIGEKFGRFAIIGVDEDSKIRNGVRITTSNWKYLCECSCPNKTIVSVMRSNLVSGRSKSCGCLQKESNIKSGLSRRKINPIEDCGDYIKIFFFNKGHGYCMVDKEDYWKVKDYCWSRLQTRTKGLYYTKANSRGNFKMQSVRMHRILFPTEEGFIPEHKDGNGLNNRKSNLRPATNSQNNMNQRLHSNNTSGHKGVWYDNDRNKWVAEIKYNGVKYFIGRFNSIEHAIKARKSKEEELCSEFSYDNSRGNQSI